MGAALAGKSACMLSLRWKVNSGCANRLAYQSRRLGGLPVMYTCPSIWWNCISMRRGTEFAQRYNNISVPFKKEDAWVGWLTMTIQETRQRKENICTPRV